MQPLTTDLVRRTVADQIDPALRLHADLMARWTLHIDVARARERLRSGLVAYDPLEVIGSAGSLLVPYVRATVALERSGLATDEEAIQARERRYQLLPLMAAWIGGEPAPRDRVRAVARRAAALVGSSILRRASIEVREHRAPLEGWERAQCPCCGSTPEFAVGDDGGRILLCARCDTRWRTPLVGCLGCGARNAPTIAHVLSDAIGYGLTICNACGRYLKEPLPGADEPADPIVERVLTSQLDAAAEARGLRL